MQQTDYKIVIPAFEGPFDLLFHLIKKSEVDIWSVSIAEITGQYLAYLKSMQELNLDVASEFLVMAATLLRLKSKLLLPRSPRTSEEEDDDELFAIDTAEELFQRLEEYRRFKDAALFLQDREEEQQRIFLRSTGGQKMMVVTSQDSVYTIWEGAHHLSDIMLRFAEATRADAYVPTFRAVDDFVLNEKTDYIISLLGRTGKPMPMSAFFNGEGMWEIIVTFIALLELARRRKAHLLQERQFAPILVTLNTAAEAEEEDVGARTAEESY